MNNIPTSNLDEFGSRERRMLIEILQAWDRQGLPHDFYPIEVVPMMNKDSGCVFITNGVYECAMMNGDSLESFYICNHCENEGFIDECRLNDFKGCNKCCEEDEDDTN